MPKKKIAIHAGHKPTRKPGCGASGYVDESSYAREIVRYFKKLAGAHYKVTDCTDNTATPIGADAVSDNLSKIASKTNASKADIALSIHLNAADSKKATGTECYVLESNDSMKKVAKRICRRISLAPLKNRGVKRGNGLYVIRKSKVPTILVECFFCTSKYDSKIRNPKWYATKIYKALRYAEKKGEW